MELLMTYEALVIIEESQAESVLLQAGHLVQVTQRLPPRLAIVRGQTSELEALRNLPGVIAVSEGPIPESALQLLNPTERVFAEAWGVGRQPKTARPGEGLAWDAEGFQPPDRQEDGQKN